MKLLKRRRNGSESEHAPLVHRSFGQRDFFGLDRFRKEIDRAFGRLWGDFEPRVGLSSLLEGSDWPAVDMVEDEKALTMRFDVPGMGPQDLDVEVSGNLLTVRGSRQDDWEKHEGGVRLRERNVGSFTRTITLPVHVDAGRIEARYDKGTLTVTIPRTAEDGPRRVKLQAG